MLSSPSSQTMLSPSSRCPTQCCLLGGAPRVGASAAQSCPPMLSSPRGAPDDFRHRRRAPHDVVVTSCPDMFSPFSSPCPTLVVAVSQAVPRHVVAVIAERLAVPRLVSSQRCARLSTAREQVVPNDPAAPYASRACCRRGRREDCEPQSTSSFQESGPARAVCIRVRCEGMRMSLIRSAYGRVA